MSKPFRRILRCNMLLPFNPPALLASAQSMPASPNPLRKSRLPMLNSSLNDGIFFSLLKQFHSCFSLPSHQTVVAICPSLLTQHQKQPGNMMVLADSWFLCCQAGCYNPAAVPNERVHSLPVPHPLSIHHGSADGPTKYPSDF